LALPVDVQSTVLQPKIVYIMIKCIAKSGLPDRNDTYPAETELCRPQSDEGQNKNALDHFSQLEASKTGMERKNK
jgi:hypothetical protein